MRFKYIFKRKYFLCLISLIMAAAMLIPTVIIPSSADEVTQSDIDKAQNKLNGIIAKKNEIQKKLKEAKENGDQKQNNLEYYNELREICEQQITATDELITACDNDIKKKTDESTAKKAEYDKEYETYKLRLRATYEDGNISALELICGASNFSDLLSSLERAGDMLDYDTKIMKDLEQKMAEINAKLEEIEQDKTKEQNTRDGLLATKNEYTANIDKIEDEIKKIKDNVGEYQNSLVNLADEEDRVNAELTELIKEYERQQAEKEDHKNYADGQSPLWPLPVGNKNVSSDFGYRIHPIYGGTRFHNGVDITASSGTPVYAILSGKVIIADYNISRGYYVVIDHGNGVSSVYQHFVKGSTKVKVNDVVEQGQVIGGVGSTGDSTGPHLHFEYRVNGNVLDPLDRSYFYNGQLTYGVNLVNGNVKKRPIQ